MSWESQADYQFQNLQLEDWGWQFIRRDSRYRLEWQKEMDAFNPEDAEDRWNKVLGFSAYDTISLVKDKISFNLKHNITKPEDVENFKIISNESLKWGLRYYQNPHSHYLILNNHHVLTACMAETFIEATEYTSRAIEPNPQTILAAIDITKPLLKQLRQLARLAEIHQEMAITFNRAKVEYNKTPRAKTIIEASIFGEGVWPEHDTTRIRKKSERVTAKNVAIWSRYLQLRDSQLLKIPRKEAAYQIYKDKPDFLIAYDNANNQIEALASHYFDFFMT